MQLDKWKMYNPGYALYDLPNYSSLKVSLRKETSFAQRK